MWDLKAMNHEGNRCFSMDKNSEPRTVHRFYSLSVAATRRSARSGELPGCLYSRSQARMPCSHMRPNSGCARRRSAPPHCVC